MGRCQLPGRRLLAVVQLGPRRGPRLVSRANAGFVPICLGGGPRSWSNRAKNPMISGLVRWSLLRRWLVWTSTHHQRGCRAFSTGRSYRSVQEPFPSGAEHHQHHDVPHRMTQEHMVTILSQTENDRYDKLGRDRAPRTVTKQDSPAAATADRVCADAGVRFRRTVPSRGRHHKSGLA